MKSINNYITEKLIINKDTGKKTINGWSYHFSDEDKREFCFNNDLPKEYVEVLKECGFNYRRKRPKPGVINQKWYAVLNLLYYDQSKTYTKKEIKDLLFYDSSAQQAELFSGLLKSKLILIEKNKYYKFNEDTRLWHMPRDLYHSPF